MAKAIVSAGGPDTSRRAAIYRGRAWRSALKSIGRAGETAFRRWADQSLTVQFLQAGSIVSLVAMIVVGRLVAGVIEQNVTHNSAASTALYVDSIIAPLLPDMRTQTRLDDSVAQALDETLDQGALRNRLISFRLWRRDGTILYSNDKRLQGRRFDMNPNLKAAFDGKMVAEFNRADDAESQALLATGEPLLEIYNPILQPWSGEVVAVSEFYEIARDFEKGLTGARLKGWSAVALTAMALFGGLLVIVVRGSRLIERQRRALSEKVIDLSSLLVQNETLRLRVQGASERAVALNERYLRQIGADLHDGPAQMIALAALKLDSKRLALTSVRRGERLTQIASIKADLDGAIDEIRALCRGLVLPKIETLGFTELIDLAVTEYQQRTGGRVRISVSGDCAWLATPDKICIYRFLQEALNNSFYHAGGKGQSIQAVCDEDVVRVEAADTGGGFDPHRVRPKAIGLAGLRERILSLGGRFEIVSGKSGSILVVTLGRERTELP